MKNFCEINRKFMPILLQIIGAYGQDFKVLKAVVGR